MRIKGVNPQERGSRKIEKEEQEREKDRAKYVFAFTLYIVPREVVFLNQIIFFNHLCPLIVCLVIPLWIYFYHFLEINCVDQELFTILEFFTPIIGAIYGKIH